MTLGPSCEYSAVLDACVLVPMALCDILLRCAEEPALYRLAWTEEILQEVERAVHAKLGYTRAQASRRVQAMREAFPEAAVAFPEALASTVDFIPDPNDRHVAAAAIHFRAHAIVTNNLKDFPEVPLATHDILVQSSDEFLVHLFERDNARVMEALDTQASVIRRPLAYVLTNLQIHAPSFAELVRKKIRQRRRP
jgi:predicted nucleic acid-binding protein